MDKTDFKILEYLQKDGRIAFTEIAQGLGVSEGTVRNRTARLIEEGILRIVGQVDTRKLGYEAQAIVGVTVQPPMLESVAATIGKFPEVAYLIMVSGEFDLFVDVLCRDREHLAEFLNERIMRVPGIMRTQTFITLRTYKSAHGQLPEVFEKKRSPK
jgi:Lrp/AsnC family transcriptional regulator for asnA, asnC and gidA